MILWYEFKNILSKKQIRDLNNLIKKTGIKEDNAKGARKKDGSPLRTSAVYQINWSIVKDKLQEIYNASLFYINYKFGFQTFEQNNFNTINLNIYNSKNKDEYGWHVDSMDFEEKYDVKATILINVSTKPYEGGKFYYFYNGEKIHVPVLDTPGNMIVLRPHIFHKVDPVTSGERRTLSLFITGPKFI
jgi:predicted 2-oxoglutarate/Fe(II)-dependent dioxygenase YbiX|tara:strand:+ start:5988 stop:6551 length:564 start_codon:yes stop_codon:yes gene_type:complete